MKKKVVKPKKIAKKKAVAKGKHHYKASKKSTEGIKPLSKKQIETIRESVRRGQTEGYLSNLYLGSGVPKKFESPELLQACAEEYFQWVKDNPWYKSEYKDHGIKQIPVGRPFTMSGLALKLGVVESYFAAFLNQLKKDDPNRDGFIRVIEAIRHTVATQKYEGAMIGAYNANLVAYEMGYKKDQVESNGIGITINIADKRDTTLLDDVTRKLKDLDKED